MKACSTCIACLLNKQEQNIRSFPDEEKKSAYLHDVLKVLYDNGLEHSAPRLHMEIEEVYAKYYEPTVDWPAVKRKFNLFMLSKEPVIEENIRKSDDLIAAAIKYACAGNYIDFGAMSVVDESTLDDLLAKAESDTVPEDELALFKEDLAKAKKLVYLTDNCGEVVLDKLFIKILKELYPELEITAILRGKIALNDATLEDAQDIGLTELVPCIGNGCGMTGMDISMITDEALEKIKEADVILSKGQGNFEGMHGSHFNTYFLFLCKCELFVRRFGLKQFTSVFSREDHIQLVENI